MRHNRRTKEYKEYLRDEISGQRRYFSGFYGSSWRVHYKYTLCFIKGKNINKTFKFGFTIIIIDNKLSGLKKIYKKNIEKSYVYGD
jgi:hypothetical protein